jgi:hypothetical protein
MEKLEVKIGFRLRDKDAKRFLEVKKSVENRVGPVQITALVRELMGLDPQKKLIDVERDYLAGKISSLQKGPVPLEKSKQRA